MSHDPPSFPRLKAPSDDGATLIWPGPEQILRDTVENHRRLSAAADVRIQNAPLPELRKNMRILLGHEDSRPLLASGHQTELYHPGVWSKDALILHAAARIGGRGLHLAVETDVPKHLELRWPGVSLPITDDPARATAAWCGQLASPPTQWLDQLDAAGGVLDHFGFHPMLPELLSALRSQSAQHKSLSAALAGATHQIDLSLGLAHGTVLVSSILSSAPYLALVHHCMSRPHEIAAGYNGSLDDFRRQSGTTNPMRPMPDLFASDDSIETPFWLDDLHAGTRTRPSVFRCGSQWVLKLVAGAEFVFDPSAGADDAAAELRDWLALNNCRIAPRALTLTMFVRLLLADQFVHGIGGARYDHVADRVIARCFGIAAPAFCVTTATLHFPTAVGRTPACLPCVRHEGHQLKHRVLGAQKRDLISQIAGLPRASSDRA
ncbi:MAG: hypothetical protein ACREJC_19595, partial [Tepidisphaeraceae bacterium]